MTNLDNLIIDFLKYIKKEVSKNMKKDKFIYIYTNKINGHQYVGQTNDIQKRFNGHKSDSYNKNSHSYTSGSI